METQKDIKDVLVRIHTSASRRFTYVSDVKKWGALEHWPAPEELPTEDKYTGDCDDFALMCRKLCRLHGLQSRLVFCRTEDKKTYHLVCESNGYILDNRCKTVVDIQSLDYEWVYISGYEKGDPWRSVLGLS